MSTNNRPDIHPNLPSHSAGPLQRGRDLFVRKASSIRPSAIERSRAASEAVPPQGRGLLPIIVAGSTWDTADHHRAVPIASTSTVPISASNHRTTVQHITALPPIDGTYRYRWQDPNDTQCMSFTIVVDWRLIPIQF